MKSFKEIDKLNDDNSRLRYDVFSLKKKLKRSQIENKKHLDFINIIEEIKNLSNEDLIKVSNFIIFNLENEKYERSDKNFTDPWSTKLK